MSERRRHVRRRGGVGLVLHVCECVVCVSRSTLRAQVCTGHCRALVFDVLFAAALRVSRRARLHTSIVCGCVLRVPSVDQPPRLPFVTYVRGSQPGDCWTAARPAVAAAVRVALPSKSVNFGSYFCGWCSECGAVCPRGPVVVVPRSSATNMVDIRLNAKHSGLPDIYSRPHDSNPVE